MSLAMLGFSAGAVTTQLAQQAIDRFAADSIMSHASLTVAVADIAADTLVAGYRPDQSCITASTMKTVTSSTALRLLGPDFRFSTRVLLQGEVKGNKLKGNLLVVGCGDPTLGSRYLPQDSDIVAQVVAALQKRGIKKIEGKVLIDDSLIPFPSYNSWWDTGDLAWDYGMGIHGLNYSDNSLRLNFVGINGRIDSISITPPVPGLEVIERLTDSRVADACNAYLEYAHPAIVLTGRVANRRYSWELANPIPGAMLADSIARALNTAHIKLKNKPDVLRKLKDSVSTELVCHYSEPLSAIITSLLYRSDNMMTEGLLRAVAHNSGRDATAKEGAAVVDSLWRASGIDTAPLWQYDGSGLARANKNSAHFFVRMLTWMATHDTGGVKLSQLMPQAGKRIGKLLPETPLSHDIVLKSGSMTGVQCYVGYWPANAPRYAFAVLVNNWLGSRSAMRNKIDQMLIEIFGGEQP